MGKMQICIPSIDNDLIFSETEQFIFFAKSTPKLNLTRQQHNSKVIFFISHLFC